MSIRTGAFATVTFGEMNGKPIAIKRILETLIHDESYTKRFKKEVQILNRLNDHPNIVPLIENRINEEENRYEYVMERADCDLYEFIKDHHEVLTYTEKLSLFEQVVAAMVTAHVNNILHRDLHPGNILIKGDSNIWLADFGLGKDFTDKSMGGNSSIAGHGNYSFVSPEQLDKLNQGSESGDVYSLGRILYFILTGEKPPVVITSVDKFESLITRATAYDSTKRIKNAMEFKKEYELAKQLHSMLEQDDLGSLSLREVLEKKPSMSWDEFHTYAMTCKSFQHDWYDFFRPIFNKLSDVNYIYDYVTSVGEEAALSFIKLFRDRLATMPGVNWPFNESEKVGLFARRFFNGCNNNLTIQKQAIEIIWDWSIDTFATQKLIISMIEGNSLKNEEVEKHLAYFMLEVNKSFPRLKQISTRLINSSSLKRAIFRLADS